MGFSLLSSFGNFYPWPILLPPCVPLLHQHSLAEMVMLCILTLTHLSPHSAVSIQQAEIWHGESRQCQQLCNGRHVGHSSGQAVGWGGAVWASLGIGGWCAGTFSSSPTFTPLLAWRKPSGCCQSWMKAREFVTLLLFECVCHPPTSSHVHGTKCQDLLLTIFALVRLLKLFFCVIFLLLRGLASSLTCLLKNNLFFFLHWTNRLSPSFFNLHLLRPINNSRTKTHPFTQTPSANSSSPSFW